MRGIEFESDFGYGDVLNDLFFNISLNDYVFFMVEDEVFRECGLIEIPSVADVTFLGEMRACAPYFVFSLNLQAYPIGASKQKINTYEDFEKSPCQFIVLIVDGRSFEIYAKDEQLLLCFIKNIIKLGGKNIKIKTIHEDGRVRMSVY